jgi:hypothetical protein
MARSRTAARAGRQPAHGEQAPSYDRDTDMFQPYRRALVEALPLRRGQVVLDVGWYGRCLKTPWLPLPAG